jgi:hypothetical protein
VATLFVIDDAGVVRECSNRWEWAKWVEAHRQAMVVRDQIGPVMVTTTFLAFAPGRPPWPDGGPALWETFVVNGKLDRTSTLYQSQEAAMAGHRHTVDLVRQAEMTTS